MDEIFVSDAVFAISTRGTIEEVRAFMWVIENNSEQVDTNHYLRTCEDVFCVCLRVHQQSAWYSLHTFRCLTISDFLTIEPHS